MLFQYRHWSDHGGRFVPRVLPTGLAGSLRGLRGAVQKGFKHRSSFRDAGSVQLLMFSRCSPDG